LDDHEGAAIGGVGIFAVCQCILEHFCS
jgi:hypothetical protein